MGKNDRDGKKTIMKRGPEEAERILRDYYCIDRNKSDDFTLDYITHGGFGDIFSIRWPDSPGERIIKVIETKNEEREASFASLYDTESQLESAKLEARQRRINECLREALIMYHFRSEENFVSLQDFYVFARNKQKKDYVFFIFMKSYSSLKKDYTEHDSYLQSRVISVVKSIAKALDLMHRPTCYYDDIMDITEEYLEGTGVSYQDLFSFAGSDPEKTYKCLYKAYHMDVKPGNIYVDKRRDDSEIFRLSDFGTVIFETPDGKIMDYEISMSKKFVPEKYEPKPSFDIYMLGATAALLSAKLSFTYDAGNKFKRVVDLWDSPDVFKGLDESFARAILIALGKDELNHYKTAADMRERFASLAYVDAKLPISPANRAYIALLNNDDIQAAFEASEEGYKQHDPLCSRVYAYLNYLRGRRCLWLVDNAHLAPERIAYLKERKVYYLDTAKEVSKPLAENGDAFSMLTYALCFCLEGKYNEPFIGKYLQTAADSGIPYAQFIFGREGYKSCLNKMISREKAMEYINKSIENNFYPAMDYLMSRLEGHTSGFSCTEEQFETLKEKMTLFEKQGKATYTSYYNMLFY